MVRIVCQGIKCDNPECDYQQPTVRFEDYAEWLNRPCPVCGWNLLTEQDLLAVGRMVKLVDIFARIFPFDKNNSKVYKTRVDMNGTGQVKLTKWTK